MYTSVLSRRIIDNPTDVLLFNNPTNSSVTVIFRTCTIDYNNKKTSTWRVYLNPTVSSYGTNIPSIITGNSLTTLAIGQLYVAPVVTSTGILLREFKIEPYLNEPTRNQFILIMPILELSANSSILLRKKSCHDQGIANISFIWREIPI